MATQLHVVGDLFVVQLKRLVFLSPLDGCDLGSCFSSCSSCLEINYAQLTLDIFVGLEFITQYGSTQEIILNYSRSQDKVID